MNLPILPAILQVVLSSMKDFNDVQGQKIASAVLVKMVIAWAQDPETAIPLLPEDVKPSKKSSTVQKLEAKKSKPPLKGFDQFVFESLVPVLFEIPYKNNFNLSDGQTVLFLTEIGSLHKVIYSAQGTKYLTYLANIAFPSLHISPDASQKFLTALSTFDVKVFKTFLQVNIVSTHLFT